MSVSRNYCTGSREEHNGSRKGPWASAALSELHGREWCKCSWIWRWGTGGAVVVSEVV